MLVSRHPKRYFPKYHHEPFALFSFAHPHLSGGGYFTFNSGKDDYNFHYDRRQLYTTGTGPDYRVGMNGWQGNKAQHVGSQEQHWFGRRPTEELYLLTEDPHQINNLADDPEFQDELRRHRDILDAWIKETGNQGQQPEDPEQLKATYELWKDRPIFKNAEVNPEYNQFR